MNAVVMLADGATSANFLAGAAERKDVMAATETATETNSAVTSATRTGTGIVIGVAKEGAAAQDGEAGVEARGGEGKRMGAEQNGVKAAAAARAGA